MSLFFDYLIFIPFITLYKAQKPIRKIKKLLRMSLVILFVWIFAEYQPFDSY